jgi:hypothetical protein
VQSAETKRTLAAWLAAFFLVALGAKLWTIQLWATNIPYWDQWDEARLLFKPWLEGTLTWHNFFIPHNEHRIVFTRLLDLLEVKLNGQWDPAFQMVVNAFIHLAYGCGLAAVIWRCAGRKHAGLICVLLLPFFALPFAAENTIHGFQSQMYFLNLLSVAAIVGLGFNKPCVGVWFCGLAAAGLAIFTMASGFLAAAAVIGLLLLRSFKQRGVTRGQVLTILCGLAVIAFGLAMKVSVDEHKKFQAKTFGDFGGALLGNLAWPFSGQPAMAVLFLLPLALVAARYFQADDKNPRASEFVLTFGLWGFLQAAALAFGRTNLTDSSRYLDTLSTLPIASVAALFVLADNVVFRRLPQKMALALAVLWSGILLAGLVQSARTVSANYSQWNRSWGLLETENVRAFIATDDAGWLKSRMPLAVPYWNSDWLIDLLRQPKILSIMPADARPALKLEMDETNSSGFFRNASPPENPGQPFTETWGNATTNKSFFAGSFASKPMTASLPKLSVQIFGGAMADMTLRLVDDSGCKIELHPQHSDRWETLFVDAPDRPFRLEIQKFSAGPYAPVAIGEIKELGRCSVLAQDLLGRAVLILSAGLLLLVFLASAEMARPGISFGNEGFVWLLVLLAGITTLSGAWLARDFDATASTVALQKKCAGEFAAAGQPARAELHLREALWLRPDDAEAKKELGSLKARGFNESLPEKIP